MINFHKITVFLLNDAIQFFVSRLNEVEEGGYWITLRQSACPSVRLE